MKLTEQTAVSDQPGGNNMTKLIRFADLWECLSDYPTLLKYYIMGESEGEITFVEALDEFVGEHSDYMVSAWTVYSHNGGFGLTVYMQAEEEK